MRTNSTQLIRKDVARSFKKYGFGLAMGLLIPVSLFAQNPILRDTMPDFLYAADPAAEVFDGKVYVYCSHDQPNAVDYSGMQDYIVLESSDMVNWINHGVVLKPREYAWADGQMNAPDVAFKDGWYYFYFPYNKTYIGVAKSRTPVGPWEEAVTDKIATIFDPTVIVDDDGQAYIYGNDSKVNIGDDGAHIMGAKLKDNMVELDGDWIRLSERTVSEAVHVFKRNGIYYFNARTGSTTSYWMADSPLPEEYATYKGTLAPDAPLAPNHASAIGFKGEWYFFYHRGDVNNGSYNRRSACYEKMTFNADGTIQPIVYTLDYIEPASTVYYPGDDLYFKNVDELWPSDNSGIRIENAGNLGYSYDGNYVVFDSVNFDAPGKYLFDVEASQKVSMGTKTGEILIYVNNELTGSVEIKGTGSWGNYTTFSDTLTIKHSVEHGLLKLVMQVESGQTYVGNLMSAHYDVVEGSVVSSNKIIGNGAAQVHVYPNPANQTLNIMLHKIKQAKISLFNSTGQMVLVKQTDEDMVTLDIGNQGSGIYWVQISNDQNLIVKELIIQ